jgi:hypothetical protein
MSERTFYAFMLAGLMLLTSGFFSGPPGKAEPAVQPDAALQPLVADTEVPEQAAEIATTPAAVLADADVEEEPPAMAGGGAEPEVLGAADGSADQYSGVGGPDEAVCESGARRCPDGTLVERTPPSCEFDDCPDMGPSMCQDRCGDGTCQEVPCAGSNCTCDESPLSCPHDCADTPDKAEPPSA